MFTVCVQLSLQFRFPCTDFNYATFCLKFCRNRSVLTEHPNFAPMLLQQPKQSVSFIILYLITISKITFPFLHTRMILFAETQI